MSFDFRRIAVDSRRFRELAEAGLAETNVSKLHEAAALCNAEFLTGFELASSPEFEDWASNVRMLHGRLHLRSLRVLTEFYLAAGEWENALSSAGQLVQLDPLNETSHCLVFRAHKASGNASALENAYRTCGQILWRELSVEPSDQTQRLYRSLVNAGPAHVETGITPPAILFASTPSGSVAYTVFGEGVPVVIIPGSICHFEIAWEEPRLQRFLTSLSRTNRVVMFDRRGIGLSERVGVSPTIEAGVADVQAILGAEKIERAVIFGASDGGAVAIRLAASKPERVAGLVMFAAMVCGSWRDDYPWALKEEAFRKWSKYVLSTWGTATAIEKFAPSFADDPAARAWWARMLRTVATPASGAEMLNSLFKIDVREDLCGIGTPTVVLHRTNDRIVRFGAGEHLARNIPNARFVELPGADHWWWLGDYEPVLKAIADVTGVTAKLDRRVKR